MTTKTVVIKIWSNILTWDNGLDLTTLERLVEHISEFQHAGNSVLLVSSWAVAMGKKILGMEHIKWMTETECGQLFSSVWQVSLVEVYKHLFHAQDLHISQALLTRRDFSDRERYNSMKRVLMTSLTLGIIPIINENDVLTPEELDFSDNDELASLVSAMVHADMLIILSNIDGLYDVYPGWNLMKHVDSIDENILGMVSKEKSSFWKGWMESKLKTGKLMIDLWIRLYIANGKHPDTLRQIFSWENPGTLFEAKEGNTVDSIRKWLRAWAVPAWRLQVSTIIADLLKAGKRASLLEIWVEQVDIHFSKWDVIEVTDTEGLRIGYGIAKIHSHEIDKNSNDRKIVIHTNYFIQV